ncbi:MAG: DUF4124 domain-containing protein [Pseudomonadales bacterium]|nr:DUF4124 domain-containing protein [Pseudomonadales bacterium]
MRIGYFLVLMCWSTLVPAEIYKCDNNGKTEFSDEPCGASAEVIEVAPVKPTGTKLSNDSMEQLSEELQSERHKRELDRQIDNQYKKIETLGDKYNRKMSELKEDLADLQNDKFNYNWSNQPSKRRSYYDKKNRIQNEISETRRQYKLDKQLAYDKLYRLKQKRNRMR